MENTYEGKTGIWHLRYDPPPIPVRSHDWQFWHDSYDGPECSLCGSASSKDDAIERIKEIEEERSSTQEEEECLKRIPPALIHQLVETLGPIEKPRWETPVSILRRKKNKE